MALFLRPPTVDIPLTDRLRSLGWQRRLVLLGTGCARCVAIVLPMIAVAAVVDSCFNLPAAIRALLLVTTLAVALRLFVRGVRKPASEPVQPFAVAMLLEKQYPVLNDAIASAVAFLETEPAQGSFRAAAVQRAERLADRHDLRAIVPTGAFWKVVWAAVAIGGATLMLAVWDLDRTTQALTRWVDPYGAHDWPPRTTLEVQAATRLAQGDPFSITITVRGEVPASATLSLRTRGGKPTDEPMALTTADGTESTANVTMDPARAAIDFDYRITANDADTGWRSVTVSPPPRMVPFDGRPSPQMRLSYPRYTLLPDSSAPDGAAVIETVAGTTIHLKAATDRGIVSANLHYLGDASAILSANAVAPLASFNAFAIAGAMLLEEGLTADIPVAISGDGRRLTATFSPPQSGLFALRFTDATGLTGQRLLDLRPYPDPAPAVTLEKPDAGTPLVLLPTATLPVRARADDRTFAVRTLAIEYRVGDGPYQTLPLVDVAMAAQVLPALVGSSPATAQPRPATVLAERLLAIAALRRPDGRSPTDGDVLHLRAIAFDWDDRTPAKAPGRSGEVEIRIRSAASLDADLQRDLAALRPELARARDEQKTIADGTTSDRAALAKAEQAQKQLRAMLDDPRDGAKAKAERLRDIAKVNALPNSPTTARAAAVARELEKLDERHLQQIEPKLAEARTAEGAASQQATLAAQKHQQGVLAGLEAALSELERWAGAGELRGDARAVKEQVAHADAAAAKIAGQVQAGVPTEQLSTAAKAALNHLADTLDGAAEQSGKLASKAGKVGDAKRDQAAAALTRAATASPGEATELKDAAVRLSAEADALEKAVRSAGGDAAEKDLRAAAMAMRENRQSASAAGRDAASKRLDQLANGLDEKPTESMDELAKKRKGQSQDVDKLAEAQDELAKKSREAAAMPDPMAKEDALRKLAEQQETLRRETEKLSRTVERAGGAEAAEQLRQAADQMEQARDDLAAGQDPMAKTEDALDRLDEAKDKLQSEAKPPEELAREKRAKLADEIKAFRDRQAAQVEESVRITSTVAAAKKWERPLVISLSKLADQQAALAEELRTFATTRLDSAKVFERMGKQAAEQMTKAAGKLRERKDDALTSDAFDRESETAADETARRPMREAQKRLDQIVAALKDDEKPKPTAKPKPMPMPMSEPPAGGPPPGDSVPPLAQLKALRDWQADVNERTAEFAKSHPDPTKLTADERAEVEELERAEKDIAELFDQLLPLLQGGGEGP